MPTTPAIEVHDLTVSYRHKPVLWTIDFAVPAGVIGAIIGPNGAGKSTLLKAMVGLLPVASGYTRILGRSPEDSRGLVAYVPQREQIDWDFPISVLDVVLLGRTPYLSPIARPSRRDREKAHDCLAQVGMSDYAKRQISQLSGGQQQRVFIARALAQDAQLYLMDEPFAGIDAATERSIADLFQTLRGRGATILCVHHDLQTAPQYFDWCALLHLRLIAAGPLSTTLTPENLERTYGGRLGLLTEVTERLRAQEWGGRNEG